MKELNNLRIYLPILKIIGDLQNKSPEGEILHYRNTAKFKSPETLKTDELLFELQKMGVIKILDRGLKSKKMTYSLLPTPKFRTFYNKFGGLVKKKRNSPKVDLSTAKIQFVEDDCKILFNNVKCVLPLAGKEFWFCVGVFPVTKENKEVIDWEDIWRIMTGDKFEDLSEKEKKVAAKMVRDTMNRLNKRIQNTLNTKYPLFTWENSTVIRKFVGDSPRLT